VAAAALLLGACFALIPAAAPRAVALWLVAGYLQRRATSGAVHEAGHGLLFGARWLNDAVGAVAAALCFIDFRVARVEHMAHHAHLATDRDPELRAMKRLGLDPDGGMTQRQVLAMLARPFTPGPLARQIAAAARGLLAPAGLATWIILGPGLVWAQRTDLLLAWTLAAVTVRPFLWLLANSTEHDFALARDLAEEATEEARLLKAQPRAVQWLACSRERRGLWFFLSCPESEKANHGDHHCDPSLPGGYLQAAVDLKLRSVAWYGQSRKTVHGLFKNRMGAEPAYASLMRGRAARRPPAAARAGET
jgi:hypothetical protein